MSEFVHLHIHSDFSLLDGANRIKDLPVRAKELGMKAMAITDHGVMYGAIDFYKACKKEGIKPIIGCAPIPMPIQMEIKTILTFITIPMAPMAASPPIEAILP